MTERRRVLVLGASGFVGGAVTGALRTAGHTVERMSAPRLPPLGATEAESLVRSSALVSMLSERFGDFDAIVNAAGNSHALGRDEAALNAANGALPGVLAAACATATGLPRFVHVSSAAVQGGIDLLDDSEHCTGFSPYSRSKILGEAMTRLFAPGTSVIYRPPGVHGPGRRVTRLTARLAASPVACVARPGTASTPQALLANVGSAIAYLATCPVSPPAVVTHPSEGLTTASFMRLLGGKEPLLLPRGVATSLIRSLGAAARLAPPLSPNARRLELLWFGQGQAVSWLTGSGWRPAEGLDDWARLGTHMRSGAIPTPTRERSTP